MGLFSSESKIEKLRAEHAKIVFDLRNEINELKGVLRVKEQEVEFFKMRGDKYLNNIDGMEKRSIELLTMAQDILKQTFEAKKK